MPKSFETGFEKNYWEKVWSDISLPQDRNPKKYHELHSIFSRHLPHGSYSFLEVGCAPGSWMSYFAQNFKYSVSGVEYAEQAYEKTIENLRLLSIPAQVHLTDFFEFKSDATYDVVFSSGFIEHFGDVESVIGKVVNICSPDGFVVTVIPSLEGLNWRISRHFRPEVAEGHYPITGTQLRLLHEKQGLKTLWSGHYGGFQIRPPFDNSQLAHNHSLLAKMLNAPFKTWNKSVSFMTRLTNLYPQSSYLFWGTVYIGRKNG
jgi:SAM-dependent methyltransferase